MNNIIENILTRRSIRSYKEDQISETDLNTILEAAKYAPNGSNSQSWHFTVIQNREKLERLNSVIREAFKELIIDDKTYAAKKSGKKASESKSYNFYYHAPTLVIVSNDVEYCNAMADCSTALENIFLAAHSLDLGSCWINQVAWLCNFTKVREMLTELGIPENYVVCGAAALGYNLGDVRNASPRKEGTVNIVK